MDVKIIEGNYGKCLICDNMNEKYGLPSLKRNFDLLFTDPPFNINLKDNMNGGNKFKNTIDDTIDIYDDFIDPVEYEEKCRKWFEITYEICRINIIHCGAVNVPMWFRIKPPFDQIVNFIPFNTIITNTAWCGRYQPLLVYTKDKNNFLGRKYNGYNTYKLKSNVIVTGKEQNVFDHPCPINPSLVESIFVDLKPTSVLDLHIGSGTIPYICEKLGIRWFGYEINPNYEKLIQYRIDFGINQHKPKQKIKGLKQYGKTQQKPL